MEDWISVLALIFAVAHVAEEYFCGWVAWANLYIKGVTITQFVFWNALFIALCIIGIVFQNELVRLSIVTLLLINVFVHLIPSIFKRQYSPGLISALILYLPLGIFTYFVVLNTKLISITNIEISGALAAGFMGMPFLYQMIRLRGNFVKRRVQ